MISVQTQLAHNLSTKKRGMLLRRWGPALFGTGLCLAVLAGDRDRLLFRRELSSEAYDTSSRMELPRWTDSFSDVWEPIDDRDTAYVWNIPQSE